MYSIHKYYMVKHHYKEGGNMEPKSHNLEVERRKADRRIAERRTEKCAVMLDTRSQDDRRTSERRIYSSIKITYHKDKNITV
jgi:hypothetical protein